MLLLLLGAMSGRQKTLFQTWGSSLVRGAGTPGCAQAPSPAVAEALPEEEEDDDDEVLLVAACEAERQLDPGAGGFCAAAGALWIYPTNCPVRDYQLHISRTALFCNTLVCLPTGLGKTFIAAVVMYNFYRWFPSGKVVFMAPTKPLVTQQMEACFHVMGIPQSDMAEMTGIGEKLSSGGKGSCGNNYAGGRIPQCKHVHLTFFPTKHRLSIAKPSEKHVDLL